MPAESSPCESETKEQNLPKVAGTSLPKKTYLVAGLFSNFFKVVDGKSTETGKKIPVYRAEDYPNGLLPPPHYCGKQVRKKKLTFKVNILRK